MMSYQSLTAAVFLTSFPLSLCSARAMIVRSTRFISWKGVQFSESSVSYLLKWMRTCDRGSSDFRLEVCKLDIAKTIFIYALLHGSTVPRFQDWYRKWSTSAGGWDRNLTSPWHLIGAVQVAAENYSSPKCMEHWKAPGTGIPTSCKQPRLWWNVEQTQPPGWSPKDMLTGDITHEVLSGSAPSWNAPQFPFDV